MTFLSLSFKKQSISQLDQGRTGFYRATVASNLKKTFLFNCKIQRFYIFKDRPFWSIFTVGNFVLHKRAFFSFFFFSKISNYIFALKVRSCLGQGCRVVAGHNKLLLGWTQNISDDRKHKTGCRTFIVCNWKDCPKCLLHESKMHWFLRLNM